MKTPRFDPVIHAPLRLQICALLSQTLYVEFQVVRDELGVSDSVLSKHLKQLDEAGYVRQHAMSKNGRQRISLALTGAGKKAFAAHVATLQALASLASPEAHDADQE